MSYSAGQKISTLTLDTIGSVAFQFLGAAQTTTSIAMTATSADLTGTSLTFTTQYANTRMLIVGIFDVNFTNNVDIGVGGSYLVGSAMVDGVDLKTSGEAHFTGIRATVAQTWNTTLTSAGSHTVKLRGFYFGPGPTGQIQTISVSTRWSGIVFGP